MGQKTLFCSILVCGLSAGCSYQVDVAEAEDVARKSVFQEQYVDASEDNEKILSYGRSLGQAYFYAAKEASQGQDVGFFTLLGIATWGAERAIGGATPSVLGRFAVGGAAVNSGVNYVDAEGATKALITAAEQMNCIVSAGTSASLMLVDDRSANPLLLAGYDTVRVTLRKALLRESPDYSTLAQNLADATRENEDVKRGAVPAALSTKILIELKERIAKCVIST